MITFRLTSKQMARTAKKCEANKKIQEGKLKKAIESGNKEVARIHAENVIREKNQALNFLRMGSRIDAVATRLETAIRMQQVNSAMQQTVKGMASAMKSMEVTQITNTMADFEKAFEDMDVRSGYMEATMTATDMSTPPEEVDQLIQKVADENNLELSEEMREANFAPIKNNAEASKDKAADDLEARLAALRN